MEPMRESMRAVGFGVGSSWAWACALALVPVACGGHAAHSTGSEAGNFGSEAGSGNVSGSSGTSGGAGASAAGASDSGASDAGAAGDPGPTLEPVAGDLRRLTAAEYVATVHDVLGTSLQPDLGATVVEVDGFDNNAAANGMTDPLYFRYLQTAEALADSVFGSEVLRPLFVTCATADDPGCVRKIVSQAGLHLFRRPLLEEEFASYQKAYARARTRNLDHEGSLKEVLTALLASAQFLYRMEFVAANPGTQPISPYDLATRLSYLLWSSAPDEALLEAARKEELGTNAELASTVTRLLQDPKALRFAQNFGGQWLGARHLASEPFDSQILSPDVTGEAADEMNRFFDELVRRDTTWDHFFESRAHFVNAHLGSLYGITVAGPAVERIELNDVDRRGFLGLIGFLVETSDGSRSSPSQRGAWISKQLLCTTQPDPPVDMPVFNEVPSAIRGTLLQVSTKPECASCHSAIDPLGVALENYDAFGRYRMSYENGDPLDASATLSASLMLPGDPQVNSMASLSPILANAPAFSACTAQKLYTYGFGRAFTEAERTNAQTLTNQWRSGPLTIRNLLLHLVQSPMFRMRNDGGQL